MSLNFFGRLRVGVSFAGDNFLKNPNVASRRGGLGAGIRQLVTLVRHPFFSAHVPRAPGRSLKPARWQR